MENQTIKNLSDKDVVDAIYLVKEKVLGVGKNGRSFLTLILGDSSGSMDAKLWDRVDELSSLFEVGELIHVKGQIQLYQERKQMIIHKLDQVDMSTMSIEDFLPKTSRKPEDMFTELLQIVRTIKNDHIRQLILDSIEDPQIKPLLLRAPAAKSVHHAWIGGLLEHILSICKLMEFMATHYSYLNRDLLLFGAVFHDIGKVWELSFDSGINYTDRGRLIGHLHMSCELIDKKSSRILGFNIELVDILKHIVLSHHGQLEYGSPKRPKFMEALVVAMIDELDSKIASVHSFIENERITSKKWSRLNTLHERYFLIEDMNEKLG